MPHPNQVSFETCLLTSAVGMDEDSVRDKADMPHGMMPEDDEMGHRRSDGTDRSTTEEQVFIQDRFHCSGSCCAGRPPGRHPHCSALSNAVDCFQEAGKAEKGAKMLRKNLLKLQVTVLRTGPPPRKVEHPTCRNVLLLAKHAMYCCACGNVTSNQATCGMAALTRICMSCRGRSEGGSK